jgi:D-alanyl-D-alanine carboxypeptidase (penicillin-binding protein 5/6)
MKLQPRHLLSLAVSLSLALGSGGSAAAQNGESSAAAYIVIDHHSGHVLKEFNAAKKLQVASLTKIATAVVVLDWAHASGQSLDQQISIPAFRRELHNGQGIPWSPGDRASIKELLYAAMLQSDNVAAHALCLFVGRSLSGGADPELHEISFIAQMNALARKLGMVNTRFLNPHGLESLERKLPYSTAEDMAKLCAYAMSNPGFLFYVSQKERKISVQRADGARADYKLVNTNSLLGQNSIDGIKTGTTRKAGECLAISAARSPEVRKDGETFFAVPRRLEVVVLGSRSRFTEAMDLLKQGWAEHESWAAAGRPETPRQNSR